MRKRPLIALGTYYLVLLSLYVISYYVTVYPVEIDVRGFGGERYAYEHYDLADERVAKIVYYPLNMLDRLLRPEVWHLEGQTGPGKLSGVRYPKR